MLALGMQALHGGSCSLNIQPVQLLDGPEAEHYMSLSAQQPSAVLLGGGGELPHLV